MAYPIEPVRRHLKALSITIAAVFLLNIALDDLIYSETLRRLQDTDQTPNNNVEAAMSNPEEEDIDRPKIYTFFEPNADRNKEISPQDKEMLELWLQAWSAAGWKPVVLHLKHAMAHPDFERMNHTLTVECNPYSEYDILRFFRFFAMVTVGGGWLSNYDVLPLHPPTQDGHVLPNEGEFTLYQVPHLGPGAVRSLASGTDKEWNRLAHQIFYKAYDNRYAAKKWNDFYSIKELIGFDPNVIHLQGEHVLKGSQVLTGKAWDVETDCQMTDDMIAVHFSSDAFIRGQLRAREHADIDKAKIARRWLDMWDMKCKDNSVPLEAPVEGIDTENVVQ
mmetsp:Transcript_18964/g.26117  ORF Transcript_18964/g.26117 Transcript_18964/m.26117 type:complete len:334 (-) Transcript_18964:201-1202(-)|eukprot:CAMPEP_0185734878 /NCGR_PEP_ID=MMETSP1171-20130828/23681_1 /TAXON_ID=374046 /ORGANISM="Helicotheca tamensis, Strain CCMP826" /LENGTH=333 /DNA_ID=CAMNT_0028404999 /DNA_START=1 /DNA_END=1002 /DNA_ORIENTATION=+